MYQFQGQQQYSGPPPAKRLKSNAVVTHYAPPPGYVPPPNAQLPPTAWQAAGYPATPYAAPPQYPQQQYGQQYLQQAYGQPYSQQQYPQQQSQQQFYPGYTQPGYPTPYQAYPGYQQPSGWQQPPQPQPPFPYPQQQPAPTANGQQHSAQQYPQANYGQAYASSPQSMTPSTDPSHLPPLQTRQSSTSHSAPVPSVSGDDVQGSTNEFDEADFSREASFAKEADSVQPELSLGIIVYYPGRPVKTALPATYDEAQAQMVDTKPRDGEDESVSRFFNKAQSANFSSSVKDTPDWETVKEDPIFQDFPRRTDALYIPIAEVREDRFRPGPESEKAAVTVEEASVAAPQSPASVKATQSEADAAIDNEDDEAMDTDSDEEDAAVPVVATDVGTSNSQEAPADHLEQVKSGPELANGDEKSHSDTAVQEMQKLPKTDAPAAYNKQSNSKPKPRQTSTQRSDGRQAPSGPRRNSSDYHPYDRHQNSGRGNQGHHVNGHHPNKRKFSQTNGQFGPHNPPPPPDGRWNSDRRRRSGSMASNGSGHTEAGGDFEMGNNETPRRESHADQSGSGRKRGYDEMERSHGADRRRQTDDVTPRIRRGRPNVPDAYRYSRQ